MMKKGGVWQWGREFCKVAVLGGEAAAKQGRRGRDSALAEPPRLLRRREEWGLQLLADDDACDFSGEMMRGRQGVVVMMPALVCAENLFKKKVQRVYPSAMGNYAQFK